MLESQLLADHGNGQRHGEFVHAVDNLAIGRLGRDLLDQVHDDAGDPGLERLHAMRRERTVHQLADAGVLRRIALDDVGEETTALALEDLPELLEVAARILRFVAVLVRECLRIAQERDDILVARHQPHAQLLIVVHRVLGAQGAIEGIGVRADFGIDQRDRVQLTARLAGHGAAGDLLRVGIVLSIHV
ncbi:MAG: hypothetical protein IPM40_02905 [Gammaproteobacteria bacterium]|nr:hypothetical protein [Gammaproteobacteria bacterium]